MLLNSGPINAQETSISPSGLGTTVSPPRLENGQTVHDITGGKRRETNLFHSFGDFSIGDSHVANFLNDTSSPTENILSRVTGGNPSSIFGEIGTTGFGAANLFLINPNGVVFGPNASINIDGSFHTSTADFLRLEDNIKFNATPGPEDALLTSAPVTAFGFLDDDPASIRIDGSTLEVDAGETISLVGGNITVESAALKAPGGNINLASVDSAGEVKIDPLTSKVSVDLDEFNNLGKILVRGVKPDPNFPPGPIPILVPNIDVTSASSEASGSVFFIGGETTIDQSRVSAGNSGAADGGEINFNVQRLFLRNFAEINTSATGSGGGGDVKIVATEGVTIAGSAVDPFFGLQATRITSATSGSANAGAIKVTAPFLEVRDGAVIQATSNSSDGARAGNIEINVGTLTVSGGAQIINQTSDAGVGSIVKVRAVDGVSAANIVSISGQRQQDPIFGIEVPSGIVSRTEGSQEGGNIDIKSRGLEVSNGAEISVESTATGDGGKVVLEAGELLVNNNGEITASTSGDGKGGIVDINAMNLMLDNGRITTSTTGSKDAGTVTVTANNASLTGDARIESTTGTKGNAGNVKIESKEGGALNLSVSDGSRITASTSGPGRGGNVNVTANGGDVTVAGVGTNGAPSSITTESKADGGIAGNAGRIRIEAGQFVVQDGGEVSASTSTTGAGGDLDVTANSVLVDGPGSQISASVNKTGTGRGGNVDIRASNVDLIDGGQISARSDSTDSNAKSGNVTVRFDDTFRIFNKSSVNVTTAVADAGDININPKPDSPKGSLLHLRDNSSISTSAGGGAGNGGNINIDPVFVVLDGRSRIVAEANRGSGGKISITTDFLFQSPDSMISAASGIPELSGTVEIDSPDSDVISGTLTLSESFLSASTLLGSRCAARAAKESSSFVVGGRGGVPVAPDAVFSGPISDLGCP